MMAYGHGSGGMGAMGLLWMLVVAAVVVVPFWRLLPQFGIPSWMSLLAIFPPAALLLLWIMAFRLKSSSEPR